MNQRHPRPSQRQPFAPALSNGHRATTALFGGHREKRESNDALSGSDHR